MMPLANVPARFAEDALAGFLDAHAELVVGVPGGVVRRHRAKTGKVAVVVGGGSGHYPAFCGLVGVGVADGAVVGNVFTSPSAADAVSVGRAAERGGGVVLLTGNYAGDVMNFRLATRQLREEGIDARYLVVTDDVASAPAGQETLRRGIAGDFVVFKVAGAAAEAGYDIDEVERIVTYANGRTRTMGVAFDGCTMPGASEPLFTVAPGHVGVGVGIHGEAGVAEQPAMSADELAQDLVARVLADRPIAPGSRVAVVVNGLGRTKYEELFVLWGQVARQLRAAGLDVLQPEVGELVTSLDMAGCSVTVTELDDELARLWTAPAYCPAYRKGRVEPPGEQADDPGGGSWSPVTGGDAPAAGRVDSAVSKASLNLAQWSVPVMDRVVQELMRYEELLGRIDAVAGDGDHGRGMVRGALAAQQAARSAVDDGVGSVLDAAGRAWADAAGGTSGVLWGAMLRSAGRVLAEAPGTWSRWDSEPLSVVVEAVDAAIAAAQEIGGAVCGDKTLLDAAIPFRDALAVAGPGDLAGTWRTAALEAMTAAARTRGLQPRVGRARPLAERSVGHPDPGAVSFALMVAAAGGLSAERIRAFVEEVGQ